MTLLSKILTLRLRLRRPSNTNTQEAITSPTSIRLTPEVREMVQQLADLTDQTQSQVITQILRAYVEIDPLALQTHLMIERVKTLLKYYGYDVITIQHQYPQLKPDVHLGPDNMARQLTPEMVKKLATDFAVSETWLSGHNDSSAISSWYSDPHPPVTEAQKRLKKGEQVTYFWLTAPGAGWLHTPPLNENSAGLTAEELNAKNAYYQLALIGKYEQGSHPYTLYRLWKPESVDYNKARVIARIIATRLHKLGVSQYGAALPMETLIGLSTGSVTGVEAMRKRLNGWSIENVLLVGQGIYQAEDRFLDQFTWAGANQIISD